MIDVAGHVIASLRVAEYLCITGVNPPEPGSRRKQAGSDPVAAFVSARVATTTALLTEGALDRVVDAPIGRVPMDRALTLLILELVTHAWDLAQGAGIDVTLDPDLVAWCRRRFEPLDTALRRPFLFGPKIDPPEGASEQDRLMAFLGRQVA